jgi:hypothetical protein
VNIRVHFDEKNPNFICELVSVAERINLTAYLLTPYSHRVQVAEAAKQHPKQIVPFGFIDPDETDILSQNAYRSLFKSCDVPANSQQMIMGRTLEGILRL